MQNLEGLQLIQHFLNVNSSGKDSNGNGMVKTISNRFLGRARSERLSLIPDGGYSNLGDVFDFEGNPGISMTNINEYRTLSTNRYQQYGAYDLMAEDTVISSALDMYADDATQTDSNGDRIWISSEDKNCQGIVENLLDMFGIKKYMWKIARTLAHYGDLYIELFYDKTTPDSKVKLNENKNIIKEDFVKDVKDIDKVVHKTTDGYLINRVQIVPDIENMFDLQVNGETIAFARLPESNAVSETKLGYIETRSSKDANEIRYYPPDKFVHFYLDQSDRRNKEYFVVDLADGNKFRFEIVRGKSMIHDIFRVQRSLELLEHTILLNRVSKSSLFRFVKVEVGQMSKTNVETTLRKVKNLIENKLTINTADGTYKPYADPGPIENFLYIPVKDGQGNITVDTVGGDINVKDIADIDYYNNKLFAGLKIPKSFLNFEDTLSSFGGGGALTKQDERYARTIKRLQFFIVDGFNRLLNIAVSNRGMNQYRGKFEVKMVQPYTSEDASRDEMFNTKLDAVNKLVDTLSQITQNTEGIIIDNEKLVDYISSEIFDDASFKDILIVSKKVGELTGEGGGDLGFSGESPIGTEGEVPEPTSETSEENEGEFEGSTEEMDLGPGVEPGGAEEENYADENFGVEWNELLR